MAYLVEVSYKKGEKEVLPIWSSLLSKELEKIEEDNPQIVEIKVIDWNPSREECEYWSEKVELSKYRFPKEYRENRGE